MPLYEYWCDGCKGQFEVLVRTASSDPHPSCPACGAAQTRKLFSLVAARPARGQEMPVGSATPTPRASGGCCGGACGCGH